MKKTHNVFLFSVLTALPMVSAHGETCLDVSGNITTTNVSEALQTGRIELTLSSDTDIVFNKNGIIVGKITDSPNYGSILLSHHIRFPFRHVLVTNDDNATIQGVRATEADGTPCSYFVHEISNQAKRTRGFFSKMTSHEIRRRLYQ